MMIKKFRIAAVLLALGAGIGATQSVSAGHVEIPTVAPRAEDVGSIDGMINAWYDVITGPAGKPRQWARDKTLYIPELRFVSTWVEGNSVQTRIRNHQAYVDAIDSELVSKGFFEREIHRVTERYGSIAHVWSTYESKREGERTGHGARDKLHRAILGRKALVDCQRNMGRRIEGKHNPARIPARGAIAFCNR